MSAPAWKLEIELTGSGNGWTDITADMANSPGPQWGHGWTSNAYEQAVAAPGRFTFALKNDKSNSGAKRGYYSPYGSNRRAGWMPGIRVRWTGTDTNTSTAYVEFYGWITDIAASPGIYSGGQIVNVTAGDWLERAQRSTITAALPTQSNPSLSTVFTSLVATATNAPPGGTDTPVAPWSTTHIAYAFDHIKKDKPFLYSELQSLAGSFGAGVFVTAPGKLYCCATHGWARLPYNTGTTTTSTIGADAMVSLNLPASAGTVRNKVRLKYVPRKADTSNVVLYSLDSTDTAPIPIGPSTVATMQMRVPFVDPNQTAARVGALSTVTPVATTDYQMFDNSDGTGTDRTANLTVTASVSGTEAVLTLTSTATGDAYVTKLQLRGKGLYTYHPLKLEASDANSIAAYGESTFDISAPYASANIFPTTTPFASFSLVAPLNLLKTAKPVGPSVTFRATDAASIVNFFGVDLVFITGGSDQNRTAVTINESVNGVNAPYWIRGIVKSITPRRELLCTWYLDAASPSTPWIVGTSRIGVDTVLS